MNMRFPHCTQILEPEDAIHVPNIPVSASSTQLLLTKSFIPGILLRLLTAQRHFYFFNSVLVHTRPIRKVISGELLTKQAMRKTNFIIYKKYVHA
jgi:hypothetical protein